MSFSFMGCRWGDLPDDDDEGSWCNSEPPCASDAIDIAVAATMSVVVDVTAPHEKMLSGVAASKEAETKNDGEVSASAIDKAIGGSGCRGARVFETDVAKMQADPSGVAMLEEETVIPPRTAVFWNVRDASFGYISKHGSL
jgi:hypothetical protein